MKQFTAFILVVSILYNALGYIFIYEIIRNDIRQNVHTALEEPSAERQKEGLIRFVEATLIASETYKKVHEKEFYFDGNLYDIVYQEQTGNGTVLFCYMDTKERKLIDFHSGLNDFPDMKTSKKSQQLIVKTLIRDCVLSNIRIATEFPGLSIDRFFLIPDKRPGYIPVDTPPPKFC